MQRLTRKQKERQDHIKYIINIAEELFSRKGYFKVKMKEIAQKAEFALATLYRFFHSKEALYKKMISNRFGKMVEKIQQDMDAVSSNLLKIEKFIEAKLAFLHKHKKFIPIFLRQAYPSPFSEQSSSHMQSAVQWRNLISNLSYIIEKAMAEGALRTLEPLKMAFILDHMSNAVAYKWLEKGSSKSLSQDIEDIKALLLNGMKSSIHQ